MSEPRFAHDCDECELLGVFNDFDLYFCTKQPMPTVIARWGNTGPDYTSGIEIAKAVTCHSTSGSDLVALRVAYLIAKDIGKNV